jgi:hypothetical protein
LLDVLKKDIVLKLTNYSKTFDMHPATKPATASSKNM